MWKILVVGLLVAKAFGADTEPPIVKLSRDFSLACAAFHDQYSIWAGAKNEELRQPGTVNFAATRLWNDQVKPQMVEVQRVFKEMDLVLKNQ